MHVLHRLLSRSNQMCTYTRYTDTQALTQHRQENHNTYRICLFIKLSIMCLEEKQQQHDPLNGCGVRFLKRTSY